VDISRQGQRFVTGLHSRIYRWTGGRIGSRFGKVENVLLTTTGRRSGAKRTTPLSVLPMGSELVLVASNGGAQRDPDWFLNLTADPSVVVQRGAHRLAMQARPATAAERTELWSKVTSLYKGYATYQTRTEREIPLVICTPDTAGDVGPA
jgi:deazaflavin-dependent oxidoreductase (nitroreductase family)